MCSDRIRIVNNTIGGDQMMVIGLRSGKEYVVEDKSFNLLLANGKIRHTFFTPKKERLITIEHEDIEFFDELATQDRLKMLEEMGSRKTVKAEVGVEYA